MSVVTDVLLFNVCNNNQQHSLFVHFWVHNLVIYSGNTTKIQLNTLGHIFLLLTAQIKTENIFIGIQNVSVVDQLNIFLKS